MHMQPCNDGDTRAAPLAMTAAGALLPSKAYIFPNIHEDNNIGSDTPQKLPDPVEMNKSKHLAS